MMKKKDQLKKFIKEFNYPEPSWDDLPEGFPLCNTKGLTEYEEGLLSAIVLIWYANHGGRPVLIKRFSQTLALMMAMIVSGLLIRNILASDMFDRVVEVNAATVSGTLKTIALSESDEGIVNPSEILESTVSGLLK